MTIVLGQPMTLSALVDRHLLHWHFDRPYAAARPSYPRPRQPSHLAGPCDRERTQRPTDGGTTCRDSASVTSLGNAPTIPGGLITFLAATTRGGTHAAASNLMVRLGLTPGDSWQPTRPSASGSQPGSGHGSTTGRTSAQPVWGFGLATGSARTDHRVVSRTPTPPSSTWRQPTTQAHSRRMAACRTQSGGMRGGSFRTSWKCTFI